MPIVTTQMLNSMSICERREDVESKGKISLTPQSKGGLYLHRFSRNP